MALTAGEVDRRRRPPPLKLDARIYDFIGAVGQEFSVATFNTTKFIETLTGSAAFTPIQVDALVTALAASLGDVAAAGESHEAIPLRGAGADLS